MTTRVRVTATPLYPGSFYAEEGRPVEVADASSDTVLRTVPDDGSWFALEVCTMTQKLWSDGEGGETWLTDGSAARHRIFKGEVLSIADVKRMNAEEDGRYSILLANMRGNGWDQVVRTRAGNFQDIKTGDVVLP